MTWKLLLCGAALVAAGCASNPSPFSTSGDYSFTTDLVPPPVPDITPAEMNRIEHAVVLAPALGPPASPIQRAAGVTSTDQ